jgi:hypothetical protein
MLDRLPWASSSLHFFRLKRASHGLKKSYFFFVVVEAFFLVAFFLPMKLTSPTLQKE